MSESQNTVVFYRHSKRHQWGLAVLADELQERRVFQFEDGKLRTFAEGFYHLMEEVEGPTGEGDDLPERLREMMELNRQRQELARDAASTSRKLITLDDQVRLFATLYPGGFTSDEWKATMRGEGSPRKLKRHRDQAVVKAQDLLAKEKLDALLAAEKYEEMIAAFAEALRSTDLVTPKRDLVAIEARDLAGKTTTARALHNLLWGDTPMNARFDAWVESVINADGTGPSWQLATAPLALVHPMEHVCVQPTAFREQARWLQPTTKHQRRPGGRLYSSYQALAKTIVEKLTAGGTPPADMLDVQDFVRLTLGSKQARMDARAAS